MTMRTLLTLTTCSFYLLIHNVWSAGKKENQPKPSKLYDYKTVKRGKRTYTLQLHVFNPKNHKAGDTTPCIVLFHSGGWSGGTPSRYYSRCELWASKGMVAISAEYSIRKKHKSTPFQSVTDGKSAIRWVRANAARLGIDPDMIAAGGASAGGQVAAAAAHLTAFEEATDDLTVSSKPNALVLRSPVFDNGPGGYGHGKVKIRWKEFSPVHNVAKGAPPAIVFVGADEAKYIKVKVANAYKQKMEDVGSRCDLFIFEGEAHGCPGKYQEIKEESEKFLTSLGFIKPASN